MHLVLLENPILAALQFAEGLVMFNLYNATLMNIKITERHLNLDSMKTQRRQSEKPFSFHAT